MKNESYDEITEIKYKLFDEFETSNEIIQELKRLHRLRIQNKIIFYKEVDKNIESTTLNIYLSSLEMLINKQKEIDFKINTLKEKLYLLCRFGEFKSIYIGNKKIK